jgi:diguanylate cyclase (GGDEF)-like protein/PAS domain S-box-containing protein
MKAAIESTAPDVAVQETGVAAGEAERLASLQRLGLLDTAPTEAFDAVTRLAAAALRVPILLVSLIDENRLWFKSRIGLDVRVTPRHGSFCSYAAWQRQPLLVRDATQDPRFANGPLVIGAQHVRSYLGIPLYTRDRQPVGTLCAMDTQVREFGDVEVTVLTEFAKLAEELLCAKELAAKADSVLICAMEREKLFRDTFELAAAGIVHTSLHGAILRCNQRASSILGYSPAQLRELSFPDITHPEDLSKNISEFKRALAGEIDGYRLEQRLLCKDQHYVWALLSVALKRTASRQTDYGIVVLEDISAQKQAVADSLKANDALQSQVTRALAAAEAQRQTREELRETQETLREAQEAQRQKHDALREAQERQREAQLAQREAEEAQNEAQERQREAQEALRGTQERQHETEGALREMQAELQETQQDLQETQEVLRETQAALREAQAALQTSNAKLTAEGLSDYLTGLSNRRSFSRRSEQAANALRLSRKPFGLILLDLDDLRHINDDYGHDVGDEVLCAVGKILTAQLRNSSDMAARVGGEEFAVLCFGDINEQALHDVAERIRTQIGKEPLATAKGLLRFTGSFGLALSQPDDPDWKTVFGRADAAMHEAKAAGKDRISFGRSTSKSATARLKALNAAPPTA